MLVKSQVKYIQSLGQKKFRDEEGVFVVEGPKMVGELMGVGNVRLLQLFAVGSWLDAVERGRLGNAVVTEVKEGELERISSLSTPNQVVAVFSRPVFRERDVAAEVSLVLDGIQDPGNMGTIIRIADWFGVGRIYASRDSADVYGAKVVQSTMGSIVRVEVLYEDLPALVGRYPGLPVYAAVLGGVSIYEAPKLERGMIVIGNESKGIREEVRAVATKGITIPRIGEAESLNAAVATGIILSHLRGGG